MKNYYLLTLLFLSAICQAQIVDIPDANFKNALIDFGVDTNNDGEIQESEAEAIVTLYISEENISSLEGIQSFINVLELDCRLNQLTILDVSQNISLERLYCSSNQLTSLVVSQNSSLGVLTCRNNNLTSLDISQTINLVGLNCSGNQITNLDLSQNLNLGWLFCYNNQLTNLNIQNGNNDNMIRVWSYDNPDLSCIQVDDENYAENQDCDDDNWCKDDWASYSEDCDLGSEDFSLNSFSLYPNPTQDLLNIESYESFNSIQIYSIEGVLVKETANTSINVSALPSGLYFVQTLSEGKKMTKKFIKS